MEETLRITGDREAYFWNTQGGAELGLMIFWDGRRYGFEFKYADAPKVTRSLNVAHSDLNLERVFIIHPGKQSYPLNEWAETLAIGHLAERLAEVLS